MTDFDFIIFYHLSSLSLRPAPLLTVESPPHYLLSVMPRLLRRGHGRRGFLPLHDANQQVGDELECATTPTLPPVPLAMPQRSRLGRIKRWLSQHFFPLFIAICLTLSLVAHGLATAAFIQANSNAMDNTDAEEGGSGTTVTNATATTTPSTPPTPSTPFMITTTITTGMPTTATVKLHDPLDPSAPPGPPVSPPGPPGPTGPPGQPAPPFNGTALLQELAACGPVAAAPLEAWSRAHTLGPIVARLQQIGPAHDIASPELTWNGLVDVDEASIVVTARETPALVRRRLADGKELGRLDIPFEPKFAAESADGKFLWVSSVKGTAHVSLVPLEQLGATSFGGPLAMTADGDLLMFSDGHLRVLTPTLNELYVFGEESLPYASSLAVTPAAAGQEDEQRLVATGHFPDENNDRPMVRLWDRARRRLVASIQLPHGTMRVDSLHFVDGGEALVAIPNVSPIIRLVIGPADQETGVRTLKVSGTSIDTYSHALGVSPDGQLLATANTGFVDLLHPGTLALVARLPWPEQTAESRFVRFSRSGKFLVAGGSGNTTRVWQLPPLPALGVAACCA